MSFYKLSDKFYDTPSYIGRDSELRRLKDIIVGHNSSVVLLAGDRGSGKTRLIEETKKEIQRQHRHHSLRLKRSNDGKYKRFVFIEIPLPHDIDEDHLKEVVVKNISFALHVASKDIPSSTKLPRLRRKAHIAKGIEEVYHKAQSIEIIQRSKAARDIGIKLQEPSGMAKTSAQSSLEEQTESKIDLSITNLELHLRALLNSVADEQTRIVFIFDELDKLEQHSSSITPADIIKQLKNLFLAHNTVTLLVSTPDYCQKVDDTLRSDPFALEKTLFTHRIQLSAMPNKAMINVARDYFVANPKEPKDFKLLLSYFAWASKGNPFSLYGLLNRFSSTGPDGKLGVNSTVATLEPWETAGAVNELLGFVYEERYQDGQDLYNELLYKTLREFGEIIVNEIAVPIHKDPILLLFTEGDFEENYEERSPRLVTMLRNDDAKLTFQIISDLRGELISDSWKTSLFENRRILRTFNDALRQLLWYLDRAGYFDDIDLTSLALTGSPQHRDDEQIRALRDSTDSETDLLTIYREAEGYAALYKLNLTDTAIIHYSPLEHTIRRLNIHKNKLISRLYGAEVKALTGVFAEMRQTLLLHWITEKVNENGDLSLEPPGVVRLTHPLHAFHEFLARNELPHVQGMVDPTLADRIVYVAKNQDEIARIREFYRTNKEKEHKFLILSLDTTADEKPGSFMVYKAEHGNVKFDNFIYRVNGDA
jgi:hypothetical protein